MDILSSVGTMDSRRLLLHLTAVVIGLTLCAPAAVAQLSPGDLSEAHAQLEGMSNCTSCHTIGKTISNDKCLACHTELRSRIESGKGSHARLGGKACVECHKEHHGRRFSIVHFDPGSFDHAARTGFSLQGKHAALECRQCHKPANIRDASVLKRGERAAATTYEGLATVCSSCHTDIHRGQFSAECSSCHTAERWKPAQRFDHSKTRFTLTAGHANVLCAKCHAATPEQPTAVRYRNTPFGSCADCHRDPHAGRFKQPCAGCHTTRGWNLAGASFNHAETRFPLRGKHALLKCQQCHGGTSEREAGKGFRLTKFQRCSDCHADPHRGRFTRQGSGKSCESCHSESGWRGGPMATFDHSKTAFPLKGRHKSIDCTKCHGGKEALPLAVRALEAGKTGRCSDCHTDPHAGQFPASTDCASCHVETGFLPSLFSIDRHRSARFAVDGSHEAVPCIRCHTAAQVDGRRVRQFRFSTTRYCADCHKDPHGGELTRRPGRMCESCHSSATWASLRFAHEQTGFALDGKHRSVPCARCHSGGGTNKGVESWKFAGIPKTCAGCHGDSKTDPKTGQQQGARP
jgi:hypothetical protein